MDLGEVLFTVLAGCVEPIAYFGACLRFDNKKTTILVPDLKDYNEQVTPYILRVVMDHHSAWREVGDPGIPDTYQTVYAVVRVANFLGDDKYITHICRELMVKKERVVGVTARTVRKTLWDAYRQRRHTRTNFVVGGVGRVCKKGMQDSAPCQQEVITHCCASMVHIECVRGLLSCSV